MTEELKNKILGMSKGELEQLVANKGLYAEDTVALANERLQGLSVMPQPAPVTAEASPIQSSAPAEIEGEPAILDTASYTLREYIGAIPYRTTNTDVVFSTDSVQITQRVNRKIRNSNEIRYDDISHVEVSRSFGIFDIILGVLFVFAIFISPDAAIYCVLMAGLCLFTAFGAKATVYCKNGLAAEVKTSRKKDAESFTYQLNLAKSKG